MEALKLSNYRELDQFACTEFFATGFDNTRLHIVSWMPKAIPRAIIMLVHGSGDHILRYDHWARFFNDERIGFVGLDIRGHGKSGGKRGHGTLYDVFKDIDLLINYAKVKYPNIPRILYGQSMGGNLVMSYVIAKKPNINGLVSTSPWLRLVNPPSNFFRKVSKLLAKLTPSIALSNGLNSKNLTDDELVIKSYENDPLVHDKISPQLLLEVLETGDSLLQNRHRFNVPLLVLHGTHDKIASWRACAEFSKYTSKNTCFKSWEGGYHELHNDYDKEDVFGYITNWIDQLPFSRHIN